MLDLIGWRKTTSDTFELQAYVGRLLGQYFVIAGDAWQPAPGDIMVDAAGLSDTVVSVKDSTPEEFEGLFEHSTWTSGFATITRKASALPKIADILGPASAVDNLNTRETDLSLTAGFVIADSLAANANPYTPAGWPYASEIEVSPDSDLLEIQTAMWFAPQGEKVLMNTHASNRYVIKHDFGTPIPESKIIMTDASDITVKPGESVALIRDTSIDRWRAARNSPLVP